MSYPLLLDHDPCPSVLLDGDGQPWGPNPALLDLLDGAQPLEACLPINYRALAAASLRQERALGEVEAAWADRILLWTFIPDPAGRRVVARARDATDVLRNEKAAARARRLYRLITENTTDLISRHAPDGTFLDASPAAWPLLGCWPETLRGQSVAGLLHRRDRARLAREAAEALLDRGYHTMTFRIRHADGHYLWFETASRAIRETYTGAVVEVVSVSRDITDRVRAEENRRRLAEVVEANTDLVLFVGLDTAISYANRSARRALGLNGPPWPALSSLFASDDYRRLQEQGWSRAARDGVWTSEACLAGPERRFPVSLVLLAHRRAGDARYYSLVARDMTERALRESEQRRHQEELADRGRLITLGELASGIAHEINQPLAAISNYAAASQRHLAADGDDPAIRRAVQGLTRIGEHAHHASEVIRRLRAFLRKGQRRLEPLAVNQLARDAIHLCAWRGERHRIHFIERFSASLPPVIADRILLEQVLLNLLGNAIDANRERQGDAPSTIQVETALEGERVAIRVHDRGPGAPPATLARMFTPFFTSKPDGLGLGLSMSRSVVEGLGGELSARSSTEGLVVECHLPAGTQRKE